MQWLFVSVLVEIIYKTLIDEQDCNYQCTQGERTYVLLYYFTMYIHKNTV